MANYFTDNDDLQYYFEKGIDWEPLVALTEYDWKAEDGPKDTAEAVATYKDMMTMFGTFVAEEVAPVAREVDEIGCKLVDGEAVMPEAAEKIFRRIRDLDLHWLTVPRELGGMNSPVLLYFMNTEVFARADVSMMAHHGFHGGMAMAMLVFSIREGTTNFDVSLPGITETRFQEEMEEIANGEAWGTMDITEPDAGSDMAALRTIGEQDDDGNWFVTGQKIFITSGHGKYHFVIARTEKPSDPDDPYAGLGGLSFFLVPAYEEDGQGNRKRLATLDRVEEKLGHHGSVTASISFDRTPAKLIGKRGEGFKYMLTLMNNARVGVGFESIGLCEAAYRGAKAYAAERPSMGKTIDRHEMIADYLEMMQTDIQGLRAMAMHGGFHEEMTQKLALKLDFYGDTLDEVERKRLEKQLAKHKRLTRRVTPLLKYLASEKAVEHARLNLQIHGGNGYMQEYDAERLLRDALVMPIYEGTSQIQALMAMKDALGGLMKNPQKFVREAAQARWRSMSARDPMERRVAKLQTLQSDALQFLVRKTATDKIKSLREVPVTTWTKAFFKDWNPKRDFAYAMLHAERLIKLMADVQVVELLLEQSQKHEERREILERYLDRAEPRCRFLHDEITTTGHGLLTRLARLQADDDEAAAE